MNVQPGAMDTRVDLQIEGAPAFARPVLRHLRGVVHDACPTVEETIKWGRPFFLYRGKMVCSMASFKAHCSFHLWGPGMVKILHAAGVETEASSGSFGRITRLEDLPEDTLLRGWVKQAFAMAAEGKPLGPAGAKKAAVVKAPMPTPEDLQAELTKRPGGAQLFIEMSPSCRREYIEWIEGAKRPETRARRVTEAAGWIVEGKGRNWKHAG